MRATLSTRIPGQMCGTHIDEPGPLPVEVYKERRCCVDHFQLPEVKIPGRGLTPFALARERKPRERRGPAMIGSAGERASRPAPNFN